MDAEAIVNRSAAAMNDAEAVANLLFSEGVVAYQRGLARAVGDHSAGLLLSQFWYWSERQPEERNGWFHNTQDEIYEQLVMTRREQETARKRLRELGLLEEDRRGLPAKLWFRVNRRAVVELLVRTARERSGAPSETPAPTTKDRTNKDGGKRHTGKSENATLDGPEPPNMNGANERPNNVSSIPSSISSSTSETFNVGGEEIDTKPKELLGPDAEAVELVIEFTGDAKSRRRIAQLRAICVDNGKLGTWTDCLRSVEKHKNRGGAPDKLGAYFCGAIVRQLEAAGIPVPCGSAAERAELRELIAASLAGPGLRVGSGSAA